MQSGVSILVLLLCGVCGSLARAHGSSGVKGIKSDARRQSRVASAGGLADDGTTIRPVAVSASHNLAGYGPERAVDGDEGTYWLVPGGQRMEMMSRDKWLVLDLGKAQSAQALSLLGEVDSFGAARVLLEAGASPSGPWRKALGFRALSAPTWQRIELGEGMRPARFYRLYIRREGHATFRYVVRGVRFHCKVQK